MNYTTTELLYCSIIIIPVLSYYLYWRYTRRHLLHLASLVPGPPTVPILGNALIFMAKPEDHLIKVSRLVDKYGEYMSFWLGPELNINVTNVADVKRLLTSNKLNQKGPLYRFMIPYIGQGILSGGPPWRMQRKIANVSYNRKSVQAYMSVFNYEGEELARSLLRRRADETFNVFNDVVWCTTQCVCQTLLGLSKEDARSIKQLDEVIKKTKRMYALIYSKMTQWWLRIPIVNWLSGAKRAENNFIRIVDEMTSDILTKKQVAFNAKGNSSGSDIFGKFIAGKLTNEEIKLKMFTMFTTSQEASAKITSAVLLFLAHLPEWQVGAKKNKVINEINEVVGLHEDVTDQELKRLPSLDMVYKEALRYLPIAALIQRTVVEDVTIDGGKITLPVGTSLVIPIHVIHRDHRHWEEPDKVRPERFLPENVKKRDPNAYIPFSLGAMDCLGRIYATALIKTLVVKVLREVELEADGKLEDLKLYFAISTEFAGGYNLRVRPRQKNNMSP